MSISHFITSLCIIAGTFILSALPFLCLWIFDFSIGIFMINDHKVQDNPLRISVRKAKEDMRTVKNENKDLLIGDFEGRMFVSNHFWFAACSCFLYSSGVSAFLLWLVKEFASDVIPVKLVEPLFVTTLFWTATAFSLWNIANAKRMALDKETEIIEIVFSAICSYIKRFSTDEDVCSDTLEAAEKMVGILSHEEDFYDVLLKMATSAKDHGKWTQPYSEWSDAQLLQTGTLFCRSVISRCKQLDIEDVEKARPYIDKLTAFVQSTKRT